MKHLCSSLLAAILIALLFTPSEASAQTLGTAANFGVLAGSTVTNTGASQISGNVGVSPGSAIVGFPPGTVTGGTIHANDAVAQQAQNDLTTAYNAVAALPCNTDLTGQDLGGQTLVPGVYCFATAAQLTGTLTLNAQGNPNAQFFFKIGSTLTTASNSVVQVINGGSNCNVFWQIGSSATIGTATTMAGNILALTSITATTGANVSGRLLARNGAVTLDTNHVSACTSTCSPLTLSPATLPNGAIAVAYNQTITASGGTAPYTFSLLSGALPGGLALSSGGAISGSPTTLGTFTFTIGATDANGCPGTRIYSIVINAPGCPAITLSPVTIPAATAGIPYGPVSIIASGGTAPYTYTVSGGALPAGVVLSPSGVLSGTPTQTGSFTVTITATDANSCASSRVYSALVNCAVLGIAPATLPNGTVGAPYGPVTLTGSGGTGPYTFAIASGTLPPGMQLSPSGTISGTPTASNTYPVTINVTDANGCAGSRAFSIAVIAQMSAAGGSTLGTIGLTLLVILLGFAGMIVVNRFTS
jgi:hypothetical protein